MEGKGLVDFVGEEYHEMELHSKVSTVVTALSVLCVKGSIPST